MSEAYLQILLILAYLSIGLISVTFPIFTICVTYLRQEFREMIKEQKKRVGKLKENIDKLTKEMSGEKKDSERSKQIQSVIKNWEDEVKSLGTRFTRLTAMGAVMIPTILLVMALFNACIGIVFFYQGSEILVVFFLPVTIAFSCAALYSLYKTMSTIEQAALRPARTVEFLIFYKARKESEEIKLKKEVELSILAGTDEEDVENLTIYILIPPNIEIERLLTARSSITLQSEGFPYANYNMISVEEDFLPKGTSTTVVFTVLAKKIGEYKIPVWVKAKGIYRYEKELILNVVE